MLFPGVEFPVNLSRRDHHELQSSAPAPSDVENHRVVVDEVDFFANKSRLAGEDHDDDASKTNRISVKKENSPPRLDLDVNVSTLIQLYLFSLFFH